MEDYLVHISDVLSGKENISEFTLHHDQAYTIEIDANMGENDLVLISNLITGYFNSVY